MAFDRFVDFLFPRSSLTGEEGDWITEKELRQLQSTPLVLEKSVLRSQGLQFIDVIVAAAEYDRVPLLKKAVHTFKYKRARGVGERLASMLVDASVLLTGGDTPVLCPVPLHWKREFQRGFNQSRVLANVIGMKRGWRVEEVLARARHTATQVGKRRHQRIEGVADAFRSRFSSSMPQRVILIDDLSTTGATLNMCAKELKRSGVHRVEGLVLALG